MSVEASLPSETDATTQVQPEAAERFEEEDASVDVGVLAEEEQRTRMGALRTLFIALLVFILATLYMPNKTALGWIMIAVYAVAAVIVGGLIAASRRYTYGSGVSTLIGVTIVLLALGSCLYFGVIGGPIIVLPTVVYYYGLGDSRPRRLWVAGVAIGGHALLTFLAAFEVVPPTGMMPAETLLRGDYILMSGLCIATLLVATYWLSHRSRRSTLLAMAALESARRRIRQRDALLDEARDDLDRAVAGAKVGRLTDRTVDGFHLGSVLGRGAMGEVYRADRAQQSFAFKVLHPHLAESEGQVARFLREVEIIRSLSTPHVPRLFASGTDDEGSPYLVLELLEGTDLASVLRHRLSLPLEELDLMLSDACAALHAAHEAGVVHRDIKPQNLFYCETDPARWMVLDFGVSTFVDSSGTLTQGGIVGTPAYMAPEQALGKEVDQRADVFSLGAVVYRALTGRPPFSGASTAAIAYAALRYQPVRPSELVSIDSDVEAVLSLALAKKPALRFPSAAEFQEAWRAARAGQLPQKLRNAAAALVSAHPWGTDYTAQERRGRASV